MKRYNNLYDIICSIENLHWADQIARKGKAKQYGVISHDKNRDANIIALREMLICQTYKTSAYTTFKIYEPKERLVYALPFFPDRIAHHAIMNVLKPIFCNTFTADTYSCIEGKGIHGAVRNMKSALKDVEGTQYCLKMDIRKFYPSISHPILKQLLRRKIKDVRTLWLLDEIIDSADGVPIGNYLSQYFANFYLSGFDHWLKEVKKVKYYFRYADDLVILAPDKESLHQLRRDIQEYLRTKLRLEVKGNYQVFPVSDRGIDFVGYVFYHTHVRLRKSIKQNFARMLVIRKNPASLAAYNGWLKHCNSINLQNKLLNERLQRNRGSTPTIRIRREKDIDGRRSGQSDHSHGLQDRTIKVSGQREWKMPAPAD